MQSSKQTLFLIIAIGLAIALNITGIVRVISLEQMVENLSKTISQPIVQENAMQKAGEALMQVDTSDWKTYQSEELKFEVKYPEDYYFYPGDINEEIVARLENYFVEMSFSKNINRDYPFAYELLLYPQKDSRIHSLDDYIKVRTNTPDLENTTYEISKVSINGQEVTRIRNVDKKVLTDLISYTFYREQDGITFTFTIIPKGEESLALAETIISTFKFIDQAGISSKKCVPNFSIESGPELTASEIYSQYCTSQVSETACAKVDIYRASTDNFGNADGIPDCHWQ